MSPPSFLPKRQPAVRATPPPRMLTVSHTAEHLQMSQKTVRRLIAAGELRSHRLGGCIRVAEDDLASFLSTRRK